MSHQPLATQETAAAASFSVVAQGIVLELGGAVLDALGSILHLLLAALERVGSRVLHLPQLLLGCVHNAAAVQGEAGVGVTTCTGGSQSTCNRRPTIRCF
jgi:Trp operon repressor